MLVKRISENYWSLLGRRHVVSDPNFPIEDKLYATLLLNASAELSLTSGAAPEQTFHAAAGPSRHSVQGRPLI